MCIKCTPSGERAFLFSGRACASMSLWAKSASSCQTGGCDDAQRPATCVRVFEQVQTNTRPGGHAVWYVVVMCWKYTFKCDWTRLAVLLPMLRWCRRAAGVYNINYIARVRTHTHVNTDVCGRPWQPPPTLLSFIVFVPEHQRLYAAFVAGGLAAGYMARRCWRPVAHKTMRDLQTKISPASRRMRVHRTRLCNADDVWYTNCIQTCSKQYPINSAVTRSAGSGTQQKRVVHFTYGLHVCGLSGGKCRVCGRYAQ